MLRQLDKFKGNFRREKGRRDNKINEPSSFRFIQYTLVYLVYYGALMSIMIHFDLVRSIESIMVSFSQPLQSINAQFSLFQSTLVHFGPYQSILVYFSPIRSTSIHLVDFNLSRSTLVHPIYFDLFWST